MEFKKIMGFAAMAALTIGAASCSNDDEVSNAMAGSEQELQIKVGINQTANTRAGITAADFVDDSAIGLYIYKGTDFSTAYPTIKPHKTKNAHYKKVGGHWTVGTEKQGIVLSDEVGTVYAYYPYAEGNDSNEAGVIPVQVNATQGTGLSDGSKDVKEQADYMWATKVPSVSNATKQINLAMNHALTMLSFKFFKGDYPGAGLVSSIKVMNKAGEKFKTGAATMNLNDGKLTVTGAKGDVTLTPNEVLAVEKGTQPEANKVARMLVYPIETLAQGDLQVQIVLDGKTYTLELPAKTPDSQKYLAGKNYTYSFNLAGKEFGGGNGGDGDNDGQDDITVSVTPWADVDGGSGDLVAPDEQPLP